MRLQNSSPRRGGSESGRDSLARPQNYYIDGRPQFLWETLQKQFFANWLHQVAKTRQAKELIKN